MCWHQDAFLPSAVAVFERWRLGRRGWGRVLPLAYHPRVGWTFTHVLKFTDVLIFVWSPKENKNKNKCVLATRPKSPSSPWGKRFLWKSSSLSNSLTSYNTWAENLWNNLAREKAHQAFHIPQTSNKLGSWTIYNSFPSVISTGLVNVAQF